MSRFRLTLAGLAASLMVFAGAFAALKYPDDHTARGAHLLLVSLLSIATLRAAAAGGRRRPFSLGFAVFGWCLYATTLFRTLSAYGQYALPLPDAVVRWLIETLHPERAHVGPSLSADRVLFYYLEAITNALANLAFALVGGIVGILTLSPRRRASATGENAHSHPHAANRVDEADS